MKRKEISHEQEINKNGERPDRKLEFPGKSYLLIKIKLKHIKDEKYKNIIYNTKYKKGFFFQRKEESKKHKTVS